MEKIVGIRVALAPIYSDAGVTRLGKEIAAEVWDVPEGCDYIRRMDTAFDYGTGIGPSTHRVPGPTFAMVPDLKRD